MNCQGHLALNALCLRSMRGRSTTNGSYIHMVAEIRQTKNFSRGRKKDRNEVLEKFCLQAWIMMEQKMVLQMIHYRSFIRCWKFPLSPRAALEIWDISLTHF